MGGHQGLRQSYITPHCIQCPPVNRRLLLWRSPLRALRVNATGVMQNCLRWSGRQSSALPGRFAPYAPPPVALVVCWRCGIGQALRAGFWSAASPCIWCLPLPTPGLACFAASPARSARPPPEGAPSESREYTPPDGGGLLVWLFDVFLMGFCYVINS